jgi:hypothetical protein
MMAALTAAATATAVVGVGLWVAAWVAAPAAGRWWRGTPDRAWPWAVLRLRAALAKAVQRRSAGGVAALPLVLDAVVYGPAAGTQRPGIVRS